MVSAFGQFRSFNREASGHPVSSACAFALAEDVISEAKASELLRKTVREVVESLDRPPESVASAMPL